MNEITGWARATLACGCLMLGLALTAVAIGPAWAGKQMLDAAAWLAPRVQPRAI